MVVMLKNVNILVYNAEKWAIEPHNILIEHSKVLSVNAEGTPDRSIDLGGQLLLPLFFNIHCHLGESLYIVDGSDWTILKYLAYTSEIVDNMTPLEKDLFWQRSAEKTIQLLIESGTGGFCAARSAEISKKHHLCTMSGYPLMLSRKLEQYYLDGLDGFSRYASENNSPYCSVGIFLHSLYKADEKLLHLAAKCFCSSAEFLTVHLSEDLETRQLELTRFQQEPVFVLDQLGLLTDQTILVHGGFLSANELSLASERNVLIAVCPISNHFLNTTCIDVSALERMGIRWCLATDGLATGRTLALIDQAAALKRQFPNIPNIKILQSMTTIPAQAFRRSIYTGMIEADTEATFILVHLHQKTDIENTLGELFTGRTPWKVVRF